MRAFLLLVRKPNAEDEKYAEAIFLTPSESYALSALGVGGRLKLWIMPNEPTLRHRCVRIHRAALGRVPHVVI